MGPLQRWRKRRGVPSQDVGEWQRGRLRRDLSREETSEWHWRTAAACSGASDGKDPLMGKNLEKNKGKITKLYTKQRQTNGKHVLCLQYVFGGVPYVFLCFFENYVLNCLPENNV